MWHKILCFFNIKHHWSLWHRGQWADQMDAVYGKYHLYSSCCKCRRGKWIKTNNPENYIG